MKTQPRRKPLPRWLTVWNARGKPVRVQVVERQHAAIRIKMPDNRFGWITTEPDQEDAHA